MIQSGIIVVNKHEGATSHDAVGMIRRLTGIRKVGHGGTLDPMATGVLPIFIGNATRVIEYMSEGTDEEAKIYRATMKLGFETDTQDISGEEVWRDDQGTPFPEQGQIETVFSSFIGEQTQVPPSYSAVKYNGKRLYEYAREGNAVDDSKLKKRTIHIKYINNIKCNPETMEVEFEIACSGGTYIRTVCQEAGRMLGNGAVMSKLQRLKSGPFRIEDSYSIEQLQELVKQEKDIPMLPVDSAIVSMRKLVISDLNARKFVNGLAFSVENMKTIEGDDARFAVYCDSRFIGIAYYSNGLVKPHKVIQ